MENFDWFETMHLESIYNLKQVVKDVYDKDIDFKSANEIVFSVC
jgi:hypothetical protein